MLFHDLGVVVLRFRGGYNKSSGNSLSSGRLVDWELCFIKQARDLYILVNAFPAFSFFALLVMNIERYLGTHYPIYHQTSVTRRKLLTFLALFLIFHTALVILVIVEVIPTAVGVMTFMVIVIPPFMFINYKLYRISKQNRRNNAISQQRSKINLKNISPCLLAAACVAVLSIPSGVFVVFSFLGIERTTNVKLSEIWGITLYTMNSTFNSLIFFWKNKVLRAEGIKILNAVKGRVFRSQGNITRTR